MSESEHTSIIFSDSELFYLEELLFDAPDTAAIPGGAAPDNWTILSWDELPDLLPSDSGWGLDLEEHGPASLTSSPAVFNSSPPTVFLSSEEIFDAPDMEAIAGGDTPEDLSFSSWVEVEHPDLSPSGSGPARALEGYGPAGLTVSPASSPPVMQQRRVGVDCCSSGGATKKLQDQILTMDRNLSAISPTRNPQPATAGYDDGYNWRKYGDKAIRGCKASRELDMETTTTTPYSRGYYKCTHPNCPVKKYVKRSVGDGSVAQVTYMHLHNHHQPRPVMLQTGFPVAADTSSRSGEAAATRPKVVVQTKSSEVLVLDDGYRWRKYGQKVVNGNHNPRSYYKCTSVGCQVRKQVERSPTEPQDVITSYQGKHNHNVPGSR